MYEKFVRFGIAQINFCLGDFEFNKQKILESVNYAKTNSVDILIFSEYSISGNLPNDLLLRKAFLSRHKEILEEITDNISGINVIIGGLDFDENKKTLEIEKIYNALFVISDKKIIAKYHKKIPQIQGAFYEQKYCVYGAKNLICKINFLKEKSINCLLSINDDFLCIDSNELCLKNLDCIINLSANPYYLGSFDDKRKTFVSFLERQKTNAEIIYSNVVGGQDSIIFGGGSFFMDKDGEIAIFAKNFAEDFIMFDLEKNKNNLEENNFFYDKNLEICEIFIESEDKMKIQTKNEEKKFSKQSEIQEMYEALVFCLKNYFVKNGFKKAILGLSGGIDSALVATLASDAIGVENVYCVSMPTVYSSEGTKNDARRLAENLGVNFFEIPIENLKNTYVKLFKEYPIFEKIDKSEKIDLAIENIQARIRGNLLMSLSNRIGGVVLATGNKSEVATGYCTLYGDTVGSFAILQDVYKTKVFELAKFRNRAAGFELIPNSIINRPPSAELRENQIDQDSLPDYEILDKILELYIENNETLENIIKIIKKNASKDDSEKIDETVKKVVNLVKGSEHKRCQSAIGPKITKKSFGVDRKMPIFHKFFE